MVARFPCFLLAAFILTVLPTRSKAGDLFTGFQIDNKGQYFSYLGVRTPILEISERTHLIIQTSIAGIGYSFKSAGQILDGNTQFIVPSLGISHSLGGWQFSVLGGPQLRRIEEEQLNASSSLAHKIGPYGQFEAMYQQKKGSIHALGTYANIDNFFWGRLRGKVLVHEATEGCCSAYVGWDLTGMGNADFRAVQTGPLVQFPLGQVFLLVRGGYQNSNSFHSGVYGGVELYFGF